MRMPRGVGGEELARLLGNLGYVVTRQTGSHIRLTLHAQHYLTVPSHRELKVGTLSGIIGDVATHLQMSRADVIGRLWG